MSTLTIVHDHPIRHAASVTQRRAEIMAIWCVAPAAVLMTVTTLAPFIAVFILSMTDYELGAIQLRWVGFGNFAKAMVDPAVGNSIKNTLFFAGVVTPAAVGLGLFFALLVNRRKHTRRLYEILFFLPITSTMTVMSLVWSFVLHEQIGLARAILDALNLAAIPFLSDPGFVLWTLGFVAVWQHMCFCFIVFLAGLTTIPQELYEAAALDGADRGWERFRRITWPQLSSTTLVIVLITTIRTFQVFELIVVLTQGGPTGHSEMVLYKTFLEAFSFFRVGYGSALTLIFVAMVGAISLLQFWAAKRQRAA